MTVKTWRLAAANGALVALVAACGDDASADVDPSSDGNGPVVAHPTEGNGSGFEALIEGTLTMSSGCLLVGEFLVVWPYGTTWDAETEAVRLSDGQSVALGDRVSDGGGYSNLADLGAQFDESLADCRAVEHQEVAMFSGGEQITVSR